MRWWRRVEATWITRRWGPYCSEWPASNKLFGHDDQRGTRRTRGNTLSMALLSGFCGFCVDRRHRSRSVGAAWTLTLTTVRAYRQAVRTEAALRLHTPVRGRVVRIVKLRFLGIRRGKHVHALVPQVQTVHTDNHFGRGQMFHTVTSG